MFAWGCAVLLWALFATAASGSESSCDATAPGSAEGACATALGASTEVPWRLASEAAGCSEAGDRAELGKDLECLFNKLYQQASPKDGLNDWDNDKGHGSPSGIVDDAGSGSQPSMQTYGELLPASFVSLMAGPGMLDIPAAPEDVFADLGSGTGKLPLAASLFGLRTSFGVELASHRHKRAARAAEKLGQLIPGSHWEEATDGNRFDLSLQMGGEEQHHLTFMSGSLLELALSNLTVVYAASLCFPDELMRDLTDRLRAELRPGALFWTLKELPPGRHPGLARVRAVPGVASWDPNLKILVYMRVPEGAVPQPPLPSAGRAEKEALSLWASDFLKAVRELFKNLLLTVGAEGPRLHGADFPTAARALGAPSALAGRRLLEAFASRGVEQLDGVDRCGCARANASMEWSFSEINMLEMVGHGAFKSGDEGDGTCMSSTHSCSLADLFAERVYLELRSRALCRQPDPPRSCGLTSTAGISRDPELRRSHFCTRLSDGRTLLQVAVVGKAVEVAKLLVELWGPGGLLCSDGEGRTALHLAADRMEVARGVEMLTLLEEQAAVLRGMGAGDPSALRDFAGRLPGAAEVITEESA